MFLAKKTYTYIYIFYMWKCRRYLTLLRMAYFEKEAWVKIYKLGEQFGYGNRDRKWARSRHALWPSFIRSHHCMAAHTQKSKDSLSWGYLQCHMPLICVSLGLLLKKPTCLAPWQAFYSDLRTDGLTEDSLSHAPSSIHGRKAIPWSHGKMGSTLLPHEKVAGACGWCTDL